MIKRLIDIALSLTVLILLSPVITITAFFIKKHLGSPIIFRQLRPGKDGELFEMLKFRSMRDANDEQGKLLPDHERLTPFGQKLRSSSLDEIPGLWNVLKGDMSLVGPRPLLAEYLPLYNLTQARRHEAKPGITGWAQINGRNAISWNDKFILDVWYVDNQSLLLDIKIMLLTLKKVFVKEGISADNHATMERFTGNENRLAILGAGGHGKVVADAALLIGDWSEIVFFDDAYPKKNNNGRWRITGTSADLLDNCNEFSGVIVTIGNNKLRLNKTIELLEANANIVSIIHPSAAISPFASVGPGSVVFAGAVINVDAQVGQACIINTNSVIEHDCQLSDGVHLSPNAALAGETIVGQCSWVGIGAVTKQQITIGSGAIVGANAVVIKPVPNGVTVVGNPATILK
jgi:sugar O-acyltransferase (sialic acid O-acetyltransferase NeuD family)